MGRLQSLLGTDEGFFLLALHSFIEGFILDVYPTGRYLTGFPALLEEFRDFLRHKRSLTAEGSQAITRLQREHVTANRVRHAFASVDAEEVCSATWNFLGFCAACGIADPFLDTLRGTLKVRDEKVSPMERSAELLDADLKARTA